MLPDQTEIASVGGIDGRTDLHRASPMCIVGNMKHF